MGNRLSKITTRTGDDGTTGLADNTRVSKDHPRIEAMGDVDELNSQIGLLRAETLPGELQVLLAHIQQTLFNLGGELAMPTFLGVANEHLAELDAAITQHNAALPPLREFILPGGSRAAALAHVCRTVCRRAERHLITLNRAEPVSPMLVQYLNRLSDLLFVLARALNHGQAPTLWDKDA